MAIETSDGEARRSAKGGATAAAQADTWVGPYSIQSGLAPASPVQNKARPVAPQINASPVTHQAS